MRRKNSVFGILLLIMLFGLLAGMAFASEETQLKRAPLSSAFLAYQEDLKQKDTLLPRGVNPGERPKGYIPSPIDLSHLRNADYSSYFTGNGRRASYPEKYDLRNVNGVSYVTPVKDQDPYNNCWAFSAIGSLESAYLKKTGTALDLSEMHLSYYAFKDPIGFTSRTADVLQNGGFDNMSVATMARWTGPVLESSAPYSRIPTGLSSNYPNRLHLQDAYFLSLQFFANQPQPTDDIRKELISSLGGISVAYYASGGAKAYNPSTAAWCNLGVPSTSADHAVLAVGWDDTYSRENFNASSRPSRDGAWLIKNSWGTGWGQGGYFWLSYEDSSLGDGIVYVPEEVTNYNNIYSYDDLGWCYTVGYGPTSWMANVFKANTSEELKAVSFYTPNVNAQYEISIYTNLADANNPVSGTRAVTSQKGTQIFAGYHTVRLNTPVQLTAGRTFSVVIKMTTPGYDTPLSIETAVGGYSDEATVKKGESFFSPDGVTWIDGVSATIQDNGQRYSIPSNVCIKAFTSGSSTPRPDPTPDPGGTQKKVVSENASDWIRQVSQSSGSSAYNVTFTGRIDVTDGDVSNVVASTTGLTSTTATVDRTPRSDAPAGKTYYTLYVEGRASSLSDVALRGLSFTQRSTQYNQTFSSPIPLQTHSGGSKGGSGGCDAGVGIFALVAFAGVLLGRNGRSEN